MVFNERFADWGNFYSLLVAEPALAGDGFIKLDGDVLLGPAVLPALLEAPGPAVLAVDRKVALAGEEMKVQVDGAGRAVALNKRMLPGQALGESIGVERIDPAMAPLLWTELREMIAYVPQDPVMFHRSLRDNIAFGRLDATDDEVRLAAEAAHAAEFIEELPDGYDTLVGERGIKLSGGQRQRVAIARAIIRQAPILVLDEATSALDSESEGLIQTALRRLSAGRTTLIIAHRLSTVVDADQILVLEDGRVVEQGRHHQLLARGGLYAQMWARQQAAPAA